VNPTLGFRARAWLGTAVDSGRRDHLHFHLDREVMYVVHKFTKQDCENIYIMVYVRFVRKYIYIYIMVYVRFVIDNFIR